MGHIWNSLGLVYYANLLKEENKKHKQTTRKIFFMKAHFLKQAKHQLRHNISRHIKFENSRNRMGPLKGDNKLQVDKKNNQK